MTTYKVDGGSLRSDAPSYVVRQADRDLFTQLQAGKFCYVLNSRQMGKSSLKVRTIQKLQAAGVKCVAIDLSGIGSEGVSAAQFYRTIGDKLADGLDLDLNFRATWDSYAELTDARKLGKFIEMVVLEQVEGKIVIFIDEIDGVIQLGSFTDDFFGLIRSCAELQATNPKYENLSFVLLGVATPNDLIQDSQRTPFNIGQAIDLHGFRSETDDLHPLINGLAGKVSDPQSTIDRILYWTGGQPFLTQNICQFVVDSPTTSIDDIVYTNIINNWRSQDKLSHLATIEKRLIKHPTEASYLLEQYRDIITTRVPMRSDRSQSQALLKLSGLVAERNSYLEVYNRIYELVFDLDWVDRALAKVCSHTPAFRAWIDGGKPKDLLLRGEALDAALIWRDRQHQILSEHNDFLSQAQKEKSDRDLRIEQAKINQLNQDLRQEQAKIQALNLDLRQEQKKIGRLNKNIRKSTIIALSLISSLIFVSSYWLSNLYQINEFNRNSSQIIDQYEFAPIDALKLALTNFSKYERNILGFKPASTIKPRLALQKIVDSIQETDEINTYQGGINAVYFCGNNQIFSSGNNGTTSIWDRNKKSNDPVKVLVGNSIAPNTKTNSVSHASTDCQSIFATGSSDGMVKLWDTNQKEIATVIAHKNDDESENGGVQNVRLTTDKKYLFTTGKSDGKIKKWKIDIDRKIELLWEKDAHTDRDSRKTGVVALNLNCRQDRIATAGKDSLGKIWDFDGNLITTLAGHNKSVNSINFYPTRNSQCREYPGDFDLISTGSSDGTVKIWDEKDKNWKEKYTINAHIGEVRSVRFSPDGKLLATASNLDPTVSSGNSIRIWNLKNRQLVTEFKGHLGAIESMFFKPDGRELATSGQEDSIIRTWKIPEVIDKNNKHQGKINSVRFDRRDSTHFVSTGDDGTVKYWQHTPNSQPRLIATYPQQTGSQPAIKLHAVRIHSDPERKIIAVGGDRGIVRFLTIQNNQIQQVKEFNTGQIGKIDSMDWNHQPIDGQKDKYLLATTTSQSNFKIWEVDVKHLKKNPKPLYSKHFEMYRPSTRFSWDGKHLAIGAHEGKVKLFKDINKNGMKWEHLQPEDLSTKIQTKSTKIQTKSKVAIGFDPKSQSLAIVSHDGEIWHCQISGSCSPPHQTYQVGTENISFSQKENSDLYIGTSGAGAVLKLWDLQGQQIADFRGNSSTIRSVNFSADGKYVLTGGDNNGIPQVWQIDRTPSDLIRQGCNWLNRSDFKSHQSDSNLQQICSSSIGFKKS
jgi:WD40 repeat protein